MASQEKLIVLSKNSEKAFVEDGFCNWKKATMRFREHERSASHKEAIQNITRKQSKNQAAVIEQIQTQDREAQTQRRQCLLRQLSTLKYILRQGLAVRGHTEEEGNFEQLLKLRSEDNPFLLSWINERRYMSPEIINELITEMGHNILRQLLQDIRSNSWYSVLADECMDQSNKEQLTICIRWVDESYTIHEDFLGLLDVSSLSSENLTSSIKDVLLRCSLSLSLCRGQGYDGAACMMGHLNGVATRINSEHPAALGVHCLAHCINLCIQDVTKKCSAIRDAIDLVLEIEKLICLSPKRTHMFLQQKLQADSPRTPHLRPVCPTRWTVRTHAIDAVVKNYATLQNVLEDIQSTTNNEYSRRARGQLTMMEKFSTFFGLKLSHLVFSAAEQLSISVQGKETCVQDAYRAASATKNFFSRQRQESSFEAFYKSVCTEASELTEEPKLPRYRRVPKRIDEGAESHRFQTAKDFFRKQYFEALDSAVGQIERRFEQRNMNTVQEVESLLLNSANNIPHEIPTSIRELYANDISMERLDTQLKMLPDIFTMETSCRIKEVTLIDTICQYMNKSPVTKRLLSEIDKLLKIYLTIPVTTSTAERSFSSLRRIKTYLRSTMTQKRLNNCMLAFVHKNITDSLDLSEIARSFVSKVPERQVFFGKM